MAVDNAADARWVDVKRASRRVVGCWKEEEDVQARQLQLRIRRQGGSRRKTCPPTGEREPAETRQMPWQCRCVNSRGQRDCECMVPDERGDEWSMKMNGIDENVEFSKLSIFKT